MATKKKSENENEPQETKLVKIGQYDVKTIFTKFDFHLALMQRFLVWGEDEINTLLRNQQTHRDDQEVYFLGQTIIKKGGELIDGQQRLTNLFITLKVCQAMATEPANDKEKEVLEVLKTLRPINYTVRENVNNFLAHHFGVVPNLDMPRSKDSNINCIRDIANCAREHLSTGGNEGNALPALSYACYILEKVSLEIYESKDTKQSGELFRQCNSTGVHLDDPTMIKVDIFDVIPESEQLDAAMTWEKIQNNLGEKEFARWLSLLRGYYVRDKAEGNLLNEYCAKTRKRIGIFLQAEPKVTRETFIREMTRLRLVYDTLNAEGQKFAPLIKAMNWLGGNDDFILPLIATADNFEGADIQASVESWFNVQVALSKANLPISSRKKVSYEAVKLVDISDAPPTNWNSAIEQAGVDMTEDSRLRNSPLKQPGKFVKLAEEVLAGANLEDVNKVWFEMLDPSKGDTFGNWLVVTFAKSAEGKTQKKIKSDVTWTNEERWENKLAHETRVFPLSNIKQTS